MRRVTFLIDGFNVYHSAKAASQDLGRASTLWLNLHSFLSSCLPIIGPDTQIEEIFYFSALALHMDSKKPGTSTRHRLYIECLESTGIQVELGRFKYKSVWCDVCNNHTDHYEEKETDVAISIKMFELFHRDACDIIVLVTGDTDLAPAVRTAQHIFPAKDTCFAFPYKRKNNELAKLVRTSFRLRKERYTQHQFPNPFTLPSGRQVRKPARW